MSLYELAAEYRQSAAQLTERINELKALQRRKRPNSTAWHALTNRIEVLEDMRADTNAVARYLERYYDGGDSDAGVG